jgi:hypothetical protein
VDVATRSLELQDALLHARVRWVAVPLLVSGGAQLVWALVAAALGGSWLDLLLAAVGCLLALATYGANHDAAVALLVRLRPEAGAPLRGAPEALLAEVDEALRKDEAGTRALAPHGVAARALPVLTMLAQALVAWRLLRG